MSSDPRRALEGELGGRIPDGLSTLTEAELSHFADLLRDTKQRQSQALESAIEEALGIVPRIVRGSVRKVLFG
ncbi:MAG: hypothetical protein QOG15_2324 [Solirubrobacteraceae bacterium]|jgi:hypothetical protein|nr:hypothetical protein [Solirubrobacteraceae bacterium]